MEEERGIQVHKTHRNSGSCALFLPVRVGLNQAGTARAWCRPDLKPAPGMFPSSWEEKPTALQAPAHGKGAFPQAQSWEKEAGEGSDAV